MCANFHWRPYMVLNERSSLQPRTGRWAFSTSARFTFLGSPSSKLPFSMYLALVHALYRASGSSVCAQIFTACDTRRCTRQEGAPFAPPESLHFQALLPQRFLFIFTLRWCKLCTGRQVAPNLCKFPLTALHGAARDAVVCSLEQEGGLFPPAQGLHS